MTKIIDNLDNSLQSLNKYPEIVKIIDVSKYRAQVQTKYPNGPEILAGEVSDLFTASLLSQHAAYGQSTTNAASPDGVLQNINDSIKEVEFEADELVALGHKLTNLRTSSLWDTASELLILRLMIENLGNEKVKSEVKFGKVIVGKQQKDADFAILDDKGFPQILIDAITPQRRTHVVASGEEMAKIIAKKYDNKFKDYCTKNPAANVAIIVCMLKNEEWAMLDNLPHLIINPNYVASLPDTELKLRSGLLYALACTFRCPEGKKLVKVDLAQYFRK